MRGIISVSKNEENRVFKAEEAVSRKVLQSIGQAWELVYNPVQPEYR